MRAIRLDEPKHFAYIEMDEPGSPGPGQVLVETNRMGICGTDYSGFLGKMPFFSYPRVIGHELGVTVLEVGEGVTNVAPGDKCSVEPYMNCGHCYACRKGATNCCETLKVIGVMIDGGLCDRFLIRAEKLHPSKKLSLEQLALVETLAIGCHCTDRCEPQEGDQILIIGAGPIGLATLEFTRLTGARVTVMDMVESRLEFCQKQYGVEHTILAKGDASDLERVNELTGGERYAVVTDATGSKKSMCDALHYVAITTQELAFEQRFMHRPEMTIKASRNAVPENFTRIIGLIEQGVIDTDPWITHRTSFDAVVGEFESFTRPESGVLKAMIEVNG